MYVKKHYRNESTDIVEDMLKKVRYVKKNIIKLMLVLINLKVVFYRDQFRILIDKSEWMDKRTKIKARQVMVNKFPWTKNRERPKIRKENIL